MTFSLYRISIISMKWSSLPRETVSCILCGADDAILLSVTRTWPVVRCKRCGMVYLRERPPETSLNSIYSSNYYENGDVGYHGYIKTFNKYEAVFRQIFAKRSRDLRKYAKGNRILEIGCAYGFLLDYLRSDGWDVKGTEVSSLSGNYAKEILELDVRVCSLTDAGYASKSFDVVMLLDVLEHMHSPYRTLAEIRRILSPDGMLVVQCPYELYHWEEILEAVIRGRKSGSIEPDAVPAHLYFFQPSTLEALLRKAGYRIIARQTGNYGKIRRLVSPPSISRGTPAERIFRIIYFRLGIQKILYSITRLIGQGNGIIRYATPER